MTAPPGPLPIEARRVLWQRLWYRLLAPPAEEDPPTQDPDASTDEPSDAQDDTKEEP